MQVTAKEHTLTIEREKLDSLGFNKAGRYFGHGAPLFRVDAETVDGRLLTGYVRAPNARTLAKHLKGIDPLGLYKAYSVGLNDMFQ